MLKRLSVIAAVLFASISFAHSAAPPETMQTDQIVTKTLTQVIPDQRFDSISTVPSMIATTNSRSNFNYNEATVHTPIDTVFGMPVPPRDVPFNFEASVYASAVFIAIGLTVLGFAIYDARRTNTTLPIFVALSGVFCSIPEVFIDIAGACFWPYNDGNVIYTILGRPMTWYPIAAWFGFGAVLAYVPYSLFLRRAKISWLWCGLVLACLFDIVVEEIMLNIPGLYVYYGHQPLILATKFPAWWMFTNIPGVFLGSALAWRFRTELAGWTGVLMFCLTPIAFLGVFGFAAMPASIVILGDYSWLTTQIGGLATAILGLGAAALTIRIVLDRNPFHLSDSIG